MNRYHRYEIEVHRPWAMNHIMGVRKDEQGRERKEYLLCLNSMLSREENDELTEKICDLLNADSISKKQLGQKVDEILHTERNKFQFLLTKVESDYAKEYTKLQEKYVDLLQESIDLQKRIKGGTDTIFVKTFV